jgi:hypothetical protein
MRIIVEHELAPDDNPCEDCNRIRVNPIILTNSQLDEIATGWIKSGGHKKCLVQDNNGKFHYEQDKSFSKFFGELLLLLE